MLITKYDIAMLVKFSVNIADADINPHIKKAERSLPTLTDGTYDAFAGIERITYEPFSAAIATPLDAYREYNGTIWKADIETSSAPSEDNADWILEPLHTVYNLAIKPYLVYKSYDFFLVLHGLDVTQAGLTQQTGNGFTPVSEQRRKEIIASNRSDLNYAETQLNKYLSDYDYLPKPDPCTTTSTRPRFGFGVVKNNYR